MSDIDRSTPIPIYYQLKELIKGQIRNGELSPGDQLPTEEELCRQYNISRTPVRQALSELTHEGLLTRTPGRGTFVARPASLRNVDGNVRTLRVIIPEGRWRWPLEQAAALWNQAHLEESVQLAFETVGHDQLRFKLTLAVAQGQAPDISLLDSVWVAAFAHMDYLHPLGVLDADWVVEFRQDCFPALDDANSYRGGLFAVQPEADIAVLWYRKDWLAAEDLEPPTTWPELIDVGQYFRRERVRARYGLDAYPLVFAAGLKAGETATYQLLPFLWSAGGDVISGGRVVLDSSASRRALRFLVDLVRTEQLAGPQVIGYAWDGAIRRFAEGKAALALGGTYESAFIRQITGWDESTFLQRVGFVAVPAPADGQPVTTVGGMSFGVYRQSSAPELALEILKLATSRDVLREFCIRTGQNPPRISVTEALTPGENSFLAAALALLPHTRSRPAIPEYPKVSRQLRAMFENAISGRMPADDAVAKAAELISAITGLPAAVGPSERT